MNTNSSSWTFDEVPTQGGRVALITGANTGLGFETAKMLADRGAEVILACRNHKKGVEALERLQIASPQSKLSLLSLDLANLGSVKAAAELVAKKHLRLDLLINNAGIMAPPLSRTTEGFESQFATNHLGHFALTGRLLPLMMTTPLSRVVVVSSAAANFGRIDLDDLDFDSRPYSKWGAYNQSKLATLMFSQELARRLSAAHSTTLSVAAHPGGAATDLQRNTWYFRWLVNPFLAASAKDGALPTLRAATDVSAANGSYWGPSKFFEMRGPPAQIRPTSRAMDRGIAEKLWNRSEEMTGVRFDFNSFLKEN